jgi:SNF2 family DNA or RNA helicase
MKAHRFLEYDLDDVKTIAVKLRQLCSGSLITDKGTRRYNTSKEQALTELLQGTDDKVVIFCAFTASIDRCKEICEKAGRRTLVFDGRSNGPVWRDFDKPEYTAIVCHYQSGGAGLNLQAASTMVMFEPCYSSKDWKQAMRRIERPGQQNKMRYVYLYTPKTIEEKILGCVTSGVSVTDKMVETWFRSNEI